MSQHPYPSAYRPGTHWSIDEAWKILDQLPVGMLPDDWRFLLAGQIAGVLMKHAGANEQLRSDLELRNQTACDRKEAIAKLEAKNERLRVALAEIEAQATAWKPPRYSWFGERAGMALRPDEQSARDVTGTEITGTGPSTGDGRAAGRSPTRCMDEQSAEPITCAHGGPCFSVECARLGCAVDRNSEQSACRYPDCDGGPNTGYCHASCRVEPDHPSTCTCEVCRAWGA